MHFTLQGSTMSSALVLDSSKTICQLASVNTSPTELLVVVVQFLRSSVSAVQR